MYGLTRTSAVDPGNLTPIAGWFQPPLRFLPSINFHAPLALKILNSGVAAASKCC